MSRLALSQKRQNNLGCSQAKVQLHRASGKHALVARDLHLILLIQAGDREALPVIPSKDGIQFFLYLLDPGLRRGDSRLV